MQGADIPTVACSISFMVAPLLPLFLAARNASSLRNLCEIQNLFLTAQSTQIKSVISVPIKDFIHHYPRALFNDIPRVGAYFYDMCETSPGCQLARVTSC